MIIPESLFDFAYCHASNYETLTALASTEDWGEDNSRLISRPEAAWILQ